MVRVWIGATIQCLDHSAWPVLIRAGILGLFHAVAIVVEIRTAVVVFEAIFVFGLGRAALEIVAETVTVGILGGAPGVRR